MAKLTAKKRKKLSKTSFAIPEDRAYPIHDEAHARNAISRVQTFGTPQEKSRVFGAISRKFPALAKRSETIQRWQKRRRS